MQSKQYVDWHLVAGMIGAGLLLITLAFVGLHFLFLTSSLDTLSWLLSGSLIALPALAGFAFWLGKIEARGALAAMDVTMRTAVQGFAPSQVAGVRAMSIMEQAVERRMNQRMAQDFMSGMSEAVPQLTSRSESKPQVIDQGGEVTL